MGGRGESLSRVSIHQFAIRGRQFLERQNQFDRTLHERDIAFLVEVNSCEWLQLVTAKSDWLLKRYRACIVAGRCFKKNSKDQEIKMSSCRLRRRASHQDKQTETTRVNCAAARCRECGQSKLFKERDNRSYSKRRFF